MGHGFIRDLSKEVRTHRKQMGITQMRLAQLSGLSRATISAVEAGTAKDLGLTRAEALLACLGLGLQIGKRKRSEELGTAFERALVLCNRGQRNNLDADKLKTALTDRLQLLDWGPHFRVLLGTAEIGLLVDLVEELADCHGVEKSAAWKKMRMLAGKVGARGAYWD